ncbi:hypothetical protein HOY82DRAFT_558826 [Tuber indicum]|nr:hypothetical protein HOY82DRAFT_558826 [Tuber indicum]
MGALLCLCYFMWGFCGMVDGQARPMGWRWGRCGWTVGLVHIVWPWGSGGQVLAVVMGWGVLCRLVFVLGCRDDHF